MTGIFITARLGSTRLSQKHLIQVGAKTFIEWLAGRYTEGFRAEIEDAKAKIFIVSSVEKENRKFEEIFNNTIEVFYGDNDNIPLRHLRCAQQYDLSNIISIDGDDVLCSVAAAKAVYNALEKGAPMATTTGLPLGMNVMGYSRKFLEQSVEKANARVLETGWGRIFDKNLSANIEISVGENIDNLRMTLDYQPDADFFSAVINRLGDRVIAISDKELVQFIIKNKLFEINAEVNEEYWLNFNLQKQSEKDNE